MKAWLFCVQGQANEEECASGSERAMRTTLLKSSHGTVWDCHLACAAEKRMAVGSPQCLFIRAGDKRTIARRASRTYC